MNYSLMICCKNETILKHKNLYYFNTQREVLKTVYVATHKGSKLFFWRDGDDDDDDDDEYLVL